MDAKDAAECSREVAGVLAKFADAGGKGDTDRSTKLIMSCLSLHQNTFKALAAQPLLRNLLCEKLTAELGLFACRGGDNPPPFAFGEMLLLSGR